MRKISTLLRRNSFLLLALSCFLAACSNSVTSQVPDAQPASSGQSAAAEEMPSTKTDAPESSNPKLGPMTQLYNAEMVMFCVTYPAKGFQEDYDQNEYRGQHVLVAEDGQSKIVFSGNPTELSLPVLFERSVADVQAKANASIQVQELGSDYLKLIWTEGQQQHYLYKWYRQGEGETVTATFEYPESQSAQFEVWIAAITAQSPDCQQ